MRLKLLIIASVLGAILGSVLSIFLVIIMLGSVRQALNPQFWAHGWLAFVQFAPPFLAAVLTSIFVYRHTSRRRRLQLVLSFALVLLLSLGTQLVWLLWR
jgi:hypothetical protein